MYKCIKETMWTAIIFASGFWQGEHWSTVFLFQTSKPLLVSHTLKGFLSHRNIYCTAKPECCWGSWSVHVRAETQQYSKMLLSNAHFESPPLLYHKCHKDHLKLWTLDKCIDQRAFLGWFADIPASHASDRHLSTTESSILGCVPCPKKDLCFFFHYEYHQFVQRRAFAVFLDGWWWHKPIVDVLHWQEAVTRCVLCAHT